MASSFLALTVTLLSFAVPAQAQETGADKDRDAIRQVVETYLYAENPEERKRVLYSQAKIVSVDLNQARVIETPLSKTATKLPKKAITKSRQKIVSIDVAGGGASVKVETDLSSEARQAPKHIHYLSLLKVSGEWKIVSILMPPLGRPGAADR